MNDKTMNILVVEDNKINQFIAVKFLLLWGMAVKVANNGQEALTLVANKSFKLILMDLDMPVMDGYETTRKIRQMEDDYFKTIPIIAFSASDIVDARRKAMQSGMTDLLSISLHQKELQNTIDKYEVKNEGNDNGLKPLTIDFDQYTEGDTGFKRELVSLLIVDIQDLKKSLINALELNDPQIFHRGCHKSRATISIINDDDLRLVLKTVEAQMEHGCDNRSLAFDETILRFNKLTSGLLKSLSRINQ